MISEPISGKTDLLEIEKFVVGELLTNCYLVYSSRTREGMLVDPGAYSPDIKKRIQELGVKVLFTLNTHGHVDHILADADFGYPVLIHELDYPCFDDPGRSLSASMGTGVPPVSEKKALRDGDVLRLGGVSLEVMHTPGHSPGGVSVLAGDVLFSGDTLFFEGIGRTDLPGGDYETLRESIGMLLSLPDNVRVFPGHGPETTIGHERRHNPFL